MAHPKTRTEWIKSAQAKHNNKYNYHVLPDFIRSHIKVPIECPIHGIFNQTLSSHISSGRGCPTCGRERQTHKKYKGIEYFKNKLDIIHAGKYDYSLWLEEDYLNSHAHSKIPIVCHTHGTFYQDIANHLNGHGCTKCGTISRSIKNRTPVEDIIRDSIKTHGEFYDYSQTIQVDNYSTDNISIICPIHGTFMQNASDHIKGANCPKCARKNCADTCLEKYNCRHPSMQHISDETYEKLNNKDWMYDQHIIKEKSLTLMSNELGINDSTVGRYLHKYDIETHRYGYSMGELELITFFESLDVDVISNTRKIIPPLELDIYIPEHNLAIEYCGLYWHSEQIGKNKNYHENKFNLCKMLNIQLLTIFEDEWEQRNEQVKAKIKSLLHKDDSQIVFARKTQIVDVSKQTKKKFYNDNHIQGNGPSSINIGLMYNDNLNACMSFIKTKDEYTLNRYATSCRVPGGFSKLLKYFINEYKPKSIISFADLRWSTGNLYEQTGWKIDKMLSPDYSYSPDGEHRHHKFNYRRKYLPRLLRNFDPELSGKINCDNNGILRIWDCGKIRFKYTP